MFKCHRCGAPMPGGWVTIKSDGEFVKICHTCINLDPDYKRRQEKRREHEERRRRKEEKRTAEYKLQQEARRIRLLPLWELMDTNLSIPLKKRCRKHGDLDPIDVVAAYEECGGKCAYCGVDLNFHFNIEHMRPISRGGGNNPGNITVSCWSCNKDKGSRTPAEWVPMQRKSREDVFLRRREGCEDTRLERKKKVVVLSSQNMSETSLAGLFPDGDELSGFSH